MTTASLELSRKIYELLGEYETKKKHPVMSCGCKDPSSCMFANQVEYYIPLPNFAELVRILHKIGEKKGWTVKTQPNATFVAWTLTEKYMFATSEPEGMQEVEKYLTPLL